MKIPVITDVVKNYVMLGMGGVIIALSAALAYQTHQVTKTKLSLETEKSARKTETIERQGLVIAHQKELADKERTHAAIQAQQTQSFADQLTAQANDRSRDAAVNQRLLSDAEKRAASYRRAGAVGTAACPSLADRTEAFDRLVAEGKRLVDEGREIVAKRDAEVVYLLGIVENDRAACSKK